MATNEATWSDKGTLSESVNVMLRESDDRTEFTHHILEDIEEENLETLKTEKENENAKHLDTDLNEEPRMIRKLTEKGEEEKIRRLKQQRTNALTAVSRKRTNINKLMAKSEEQLPQKTVGRLSFTAFSASSRPTVGRMSVICWPSVG